MNSGSPRPITSEVSRNRAILLRRREACGIFHGRKVYSRRSAATARRDFRNMTVTNVELLKLGLRIRASRKVLGWTQQRFSRNCGLDRRYFGGVERGKRNMTFSVLCQICDGLSCDIATVTKGIPHLQTVGGLASGSRVLDSDRERAEGKFQKPGKMGSKKEREIV